MDSSDGHLSGRYDKANEPESTDLDRGSNTCIDSDASHSTRSLTFLTTRSTNSQVIDGEYGDDIRHEWVQKDDIAAKCLQCEIKKLPCDTRRPSCTRCERMNDKPCLVQRQTALRDILKGGEPLRLGVLLPLDGENARWWEIKREKQKQLLAVEHLRNIWALPKIDSVRSGSFIMRLGREQGRVDTGAADGAMVRWSSVRRLPALSAADTRRDSGTHRLGLALDTEKCEQTMCEESAKGEP